MDRTAWLRERRAAVEAEYDAEADAFDADPYPRHQHAAFVDRLLATCPPGGTVLDAPCGTGHYFEQIHAAGRSVVGVDQSAGMLAVARGRRLAVRLEQVGLQELALEAAVDGAMTVDALENVPPEDWPLVVGNVVRAIRPGGHWYLTVEETDPADIEAAFRAATAMGLPVVEGEVIEGDTAGYHYYPGRDRVRSWLSLAGLTIVAEADDPYDGWAYWHVLARTHVE